MHHKPVPERLKKRITEIGGLSPNGSPLFRVMWGAERLTVIGGLWKKYDSNNNYIGETVEERLVPKYPNAVDRFIFEMWCPPENYGTPEQWNESFRQWIDGKSINTLGEFPYRGEYELVRALETPEKKAFVPLTEAICDAIVVTAKMNRDLPNRIKMEAAKDRREKAERDRVARQCDIIENLERPSWAKKEHVIVPSMEEIRKYA